MAFLSRLSVQTNNMLRVCAVVFLVSLVAVTLGGEQPEDLEVTDKPSWNRGMLFNNEGKIYFNYGWGMEVDFDIEIFRHVQDSLRDMAYGVSTCIFHTLISDQDEILEGLMSAQEDLLAALAPTPNLHNITPAANLVLFEIADMVVNVTISGKNGCRLDLDTQTAHLDFSFALEVETRRVGSFLNFLNHELEQTCVPSPPQGNSTIFKLLHQINPRLKP